MCACMRACMHVCCHVLCSDDIVLKSERSAAFVVSHYFLGKFVNFKYISFLYTC